MIKVNKKMLKRFLEIAENYGEMVFGDEKQIKEQLEMLLNRQGYWSGCRYRIFYDEYDKDFFVESRF